MVLNLDPEKPLQLNLKLHLQYNDHCLHLAQHYMHLKTEDWISKKQKNLVPLSTCTLCYPMILEIFIKTFPSDPLALNDFAKLLPAH